MDFRGNEDVRACDNIREEKQPYLLSQYSASPTIYQILANFRENIDPTPDIWTFYDNVFNIATAQGVGLDIWGAIIGMDRTIYDQSTSTKITLDDEGYRKLLYYKALANITDASLYTLNYMINQLFPDYSVTVLNVLVEKQTEDGMYYNSYPMHVRFLFKSYLSDEDLAIFKVGGPLCVGAGVGWDLVMIDTSNVFGFDGSGLQPFNCGVFMPDGGIFVPDDEETISD